MKLDFNTLGIDIGSTTVKIAILNKNGEIIFSDYQRHYANIQETLAKIVDKAYEEFGCLCWQAQIFREMYWPDLTSCGWDFCFTACFLQ